MFIRLRHSDTKPLTPALDHHQRHPAPLPPIGGALPFVQFAASISKLATDRNGQSFGGGGGGAANARARARRRNAAAAHGGGGGAGSSALAGYGQRVSASAVC